MMFKASVLQHQIHNSQPLKIISLFFFKTFTAKVMFHFKYNYQKFRMANSRRITIKLNIHCNTYTAKDNLVSNLGTQIYSVILSWLQNSIQHKRPNSRNGRLLQNMHGIRTWTHAQSQHPRYINTHLWITHKITQYCKFMIIQT